MNVVIRFRAPATVEQWEEVGCKSRYQPAKACFVANADVARLTKLMWEKRYIERIVPQPDDLKTRF